MSIWVWAFANHKIDFNQFEGNHKLVKEISDKLNSLCLSDNEGICKKFKCPRGCKWEFEGCNEADDLPTTFQFSLGNYDLEISTNFLWIDTLCFPYTHWFNPRNDYEKNEIRQWSAIIHSIVKALGGDTIEYFPDNMLEPCSLMPTAIEDYKNLTMEKHIVILKQQWSNICETYEEAKAQWNNNDCVPLLIEKI